MEIACVSVPKTAVTLFVFDSLVIGGACGLAYIGAQNIGLNAVLAANIGFQFSPLMNGLGSLIYGLAIFMAIFVLGMYQRSFMFGMRLVRSGLVAAALTWLFVAWPIAALGYLSPELSLADLALRHATLFAILVSSRPVVCHVLNLFARKRRVALIGSSSMMDGMELALKRATPSELIVVNNQLVDCASESIYFRDALSNVYGRSDIDEIVVDLPQSEVNSLRNSDWFNTIDAEGPRIVTKSEALERIARWSDTTDTKEFTADVSDDSTRRLIKYGMERALAIVGLIFFLPAMIAVAIAIKLDDGGPLFYRQNRVGKDGEVFGILKFRSMITNAEANGSPQWAKVADSRVTRVGRFIRMTRLDELPQLLNIARGEMALVGPRPERPEIVAELEKKIPGYELRHLVRPGLTGWAQINFPYGGDLESAKRKTEFDLYYIKKWSIWLDLAVIAQTVRVVLFAEGSR